MKRVEQYEEELSKIYAMRTGTKLSISKPYTFNEKIQWLKLYDTTPLKTILADKYLVRAWIKGKIGEQYLVPILGVWDRFEEINLKELPDSFVLKANHGSGWNVVVKDKSKVDWEAVRKKFDCWLSVNFAFLAGFEMQYKDIPPKIIAEEYIENEDGNLYDYKIYCFQGKPEYIHLIGNRNFDTHCAKEAFYDVNWVLQPFICGIYSRYDESIQRPSNLNEILRVAEILSEGFSYVRVDMYELSNGEIKFGEMTFTPGSGFYQWNPPEMDKVLGEKIRLPSK